MSGRNYSTPILKGLEAVFTTNTIVPFQTNVANSLTTTTLAFTTALPSAESNSLWKLEATRELLALDVDGDDHPMSALQQERRVLYLCAYCKMVAIVLYSFLSVVAFLGNSLILAVFVCIRRLRTPTNMLIANLAVADLMISVFCIPLSYWHVIIFEDQRWIFGAFLCKIFNYLQATAVFLSSWTLVAISFDRFMAIWFVMSPWLRINRRKAVYVIIVTWIFSLTMALPLLIVNQVEESRLVQTCLEKWELVRGFLIFGDDEAQAVHAYTWLVFALQYCLPLLVLLITYTFIGLRMWNSKVPGEPTPHSSANQFASSAEKNPQKSVHAQERRHESVKKLIPMVLLVSALYAGCWLPQNLLMNIWISYEPSITSSPYILYIWWGSHTLAMFHSIVNPFIYYCQNKRIHEAVNYLLAYLPCTRSAHQHTPLLAINFNDENTINANTHNLHNSHIQKHSKSGTDGVRIVNMVAYMPAAGGKRVQPHPNAMISPPPSSGSATANNNSHKNNNDNNNINDNNVGATNRTSTFKKHDTTDFW